MTTRGDQILDRPLAKVGGKGLFVKELETALLDGSADIAVHSMKDVPMVLEPEFALVAISEREVPMDAFVSNKYARLEDLPPRRSGRDVQPAPRVAVARAASRISWSPACAAISTRACASWTKAITTRSSSPLPASRGSAWRDRVRSVPAHRGVPARGRAGGAGYRGAGDAARGRAVGGAAQRCLPRSACVRAERAVSRALAGSCEVPLGAYAEDAGRGALAARVCRTARRPAHGLRRTERGRRSGGAWAWPRAELRAQGADEILAALG